ncbi:MAG: pyruvate, phosphate dikinase/phosphoenolpyruvate synthase regulator [Pirellulaceae bacterium]
MSKKKKKTTTSKTTKKPIKKRRAAKKPAANPQAAATDTRHYTVHVLTTSTGDLVSRLVGAVLTQFSGSTFQRVSHPLQDNLQKLERTLQKIDKENALVVHALASPDAKRLVRKYCVEDRIPHFDVTGPLVYFISDHVGEFPADDVARLHQVDADYFRRVDAMEFTMQHDDGLGVDTLEQAEIVIVGLSRVSKSPTSLFLGSRGFRVANVSIAPEVGFPPELRKVKKKIVAFTVQPKRLQEIRAARFPQLEGVKYHNLTDVIQEVMQAEAEYRKRKYPLIDITNLTIEQTAARVLESLKLQIR